ncbi:hypothetical protein GF336_01870 [Candidatus Woesearchaeota archaeon]|nr:hypothetical protein [Candidatus Woesearchaeota archaeon]
MTEAINKLGIRIIGLQRTGNHPIINWIIKSSKKKYLFVNSIGPSVMPYGFSLLHAEGDYEFNGSMYDVIKKNIIKELSKEKKELVIYSHEDETLDTIKKCDRSTETYFGGFEKHFNVLILRDPFNLFASQMKSRWISYSDIKYNVQIWKEYAREFLEGSMLDNFVGINYNRWVVDKEYRKETASKFGFESDESVIRVVSSYGSGSSFGDKEISKEKLMSRWESFKDNEDYRFLFDKEVFELSEKIFGDISGTSELLV